MRKFKKMNEEIVEIYGDVEQRGILENEDGLFELCDVDNKDSFTTVDVVHKDGIYYVDYAETSIWADSNIVTGSLINTKNELLRLVNIKRKKYGYELLSDITAEEYAKGIEEDTEDRFDDTVYFLTEGDGSKEV